MFKAFKHFKKICLHKKYVFYFCRKAGIPFRGLTHDLSKFSPTEFIESVRFFQGTSSPILAAKTTQGYSLAWLHHKSHNKHHWEFWTDNYSSGITGVKMPYVYAVEMICDWFAASRAYNNNISLAAEVEWWERKRNTMILHPKTREFIEQIMKHIKTTNEFPNSKFFQSTYKIIDKKRKNKNGKLLN